MIADFGDDADGETGSAKPELHNCEHYAYYQSNTRDNREALYHQQARYERQRYCT